MGSLEQNEAMAVSIFRGEGSVWSSLKLRHGNIDSVGLCAAVGMCDRDSVQIVASVWGTRVLYAMTIGCDSRSGGWRTVLSGERRVRESIGGWIA